MYESTVYVSSEHVGHGLDGVLPEGAAVPDQRLLVDGAHLGPLDLVQRVDQVHEGLEVPAKTWHKSTLQFGPLVIT